MVTHAAAASDGSPERAAADAYLASSSLTLTALVAAMSRVELSDDPTTTADNLAIAAALAQLEATRTRVELDLNAFVFEQGILEPPPPGSYQKIKSVCDTLGRLTQAQIRAGAALTLATELLGLLPRITRP